MLGVFARLSRRRVCRVSRVRQQFTRPPRARSFARGKVNFFSWSPGQQPRAGRVFFVFFFVGATMSTYSAGRSSSGNAQSGDVLPACGSGSSEYSEPLRKVSGRGRSKAAGDME